MNENHSQIMYHVNLNVSLIAEKYLKSKSE